MMQANCPEFDNGQTRLTVSVLVYWHLTWGLVLASSSPLIRISYNQLNVGQQQCQYNIQP